jgi:hypothetical protein
VKGSDEVGAGKQRSKAQGEGSISLTLMSEACEASGPARRLEEQVSVASRRTRFALALEGLLDQRHDVHAILSSRATSSKESWKGGGFRQPSQLSSVRASAQMVCPSGEQQRQSRRLTGHHMRSSPLTKDERKRM